MEILKKGRLGLEETREKSARRRISPSASKPPGLVSLSNGWRQIHACVGADWRGREFLI
ncbi:hypothetical protein SCLCIDRAFT_1222459 [Scleroderma citrinum Foug A]|uniref:Uncharacterized protein n=1 Tax=Scleroderma citrinum Foug A TaxID=1036808 RepID=A0A0C2ZMS8_9AGAM|nr:hypothetical protein SCLCIDRAFT_1222459 [Scleroderma citrinum Foug A]